MNVAFACSLRLILPVALRAQFVQRVDVREVGAVRVRVAARGAVARTVVRVRVVATRGVDTRGVRTAATRGVALRARVDAPLERDDPEL